MYIQLALKLRTYGSVYSCIDVWLFDVVVLFHLLAIADKIHGNHCAPRSVEILIKYAFP